jgi:hypothetical protein
VNRYQLDITVAIVYLNIWLIFLLKNVGEREQRYRFDAEQQPTFSANY